MKNFFASAALIIALPYYAACVQIPAPYGSVNDFAGIIDPGTKSKIESVINSLKQATGAEIAVVTFSSLEGENIEDFSNRLFNQWGIGRKGKDDGLLVLVSLAERSVRIETGYGIEAVIPDGKAGRIIRTNIVPFFKQGKYSDGILSGVYTAASEIAASQGAELGIDNESMPASASTAADKLKALIFLIFMLFLLFRHPFLFLLFGGFGGRSRGGFGGGGFGGGFGGFGGGMSGGGGATGRW